MDEREFTSLLREYAGLLSRVAASYEAEPAARDDLLQDIALALWKALPRWRGEASLKTFVARVAHNRGAT
ncbi:MAG: sigma-70 family RNA polymerase sigma factor, partial [Xanthomonadales bacterium]|nr:sigma-70 family RNA polymerase sigma factor [Xanthomonadales bacterium]